MPILQRPLRALIGVFVALVAVTASAGSAGAVGYADPTISSVSDETPTAGSDLTLSGSGFGANEDISNVLFSTPRTLAPAVSDASGNFSTVVKLPSDISNGVHTIVSTGATTGHVSSIKITVSGGTDPASDPSPSDNSTSTPSGSGSDSNGTNTASGDTAGADSGSNGDSELAFTGTTVISIGALAALLLLGGVLLVLASRRRRINA